MWSYATLDPFSFDLYSRFFFAISSLMSCVLWFFLIHFALKGTIFNVFFSLHSPLHTPLNSGFIFFNILKSYVLFFSEIFQIEKSTDYFYPSWWVKIFILMLSFFKWYITKSYILMCNVSLRFIVTYFICAFLCNCFIENV